MRLNRSIQALLGSTFLVAGMAGSAPAWAQDQAPPADQAQTTGVADIIVTAQRRAERNQDVPIAITAFSGASLQQRNISTAQDLQASVPSLVVGSNGQGSRDSQTFTLRGQGATFQASPGVVVYMNEVPLPAPISLSQQGGPGNYVDLENLQVLAGPQGTLFGRNTTGGAVLLVPHKPTNDLSGSVMAKIGNYNAREVEGVLNVPIVDDKLLVRVVGAYHDRDGYTRDVIHNKDLDNTHWYSGRIGITFRPTETVENYLMVYAANSKFNGTGLIHEGFNIAGLAGSGLCTDDPTNLAVGSCDDYRALTAQAKALGPRATAPGVDSSQRTKTWGAINTTSVDLTDELTVRNIVSYQRFKSHYYYDADGTIAQQYDGSLPSNPLPRDYLEEFTEELQLQGNLLDKRLIFTVGGFYYDQKPAGKQGLDQLVYCPLAYTGYCTPSTQISSVRSKSKALYAQATLDFGLVSPALENLKLTGGYRYTWDTIAGSASTYTPVQTEGGTVYTCSYDNSTVTGDPEAGCSFADTLHSKASTWTVGLDYKLTRSVLLYGKISRGYKAGGFNPYAVFEDTRTFKPEYVTSYEAGFKSDLRLGNVPTRLNATYYWLNYSSIQKATGDFNSITKVSGARIIPASAHIQGVELDATMRPFPGLEIGGTFSYTDFKYTKYTVPADGFSADCSGSVPAAGTLADISCLKGQYISPYIYSIHTSATIPVSETLGDLTLFVSYSHNAAQHTEAVILPPNQPGERLGAFGLLNASLDWTNIAGSGFDAGVFVTNATNKLYRISNSDVYQSLLSWSSIYGEPRMYGLRLRYHFGPQ